MPVKRQTRTVETQKEVFVTSDGREFGTERAAAHHESIIQGPKLRSQYQVKDLDSIFCQLQVEDGNQYFDQAWVFIVLEGKTPVQVRMDLEAIFDTDLSESSEFSDASSGKYVALFMPEDDCVCISSLSLILEKTKEDLKSL